MVLVMNAYLTYGVSCIVIHHVEVSSVTMANALMSDLVQK